MKRSKRILVLVAILVVVCVATLALTRYEEKQEQIQNSDAVILEIPSDTVQSLSWEYSGGGDLVFNKTEDGWKYQEDAAFPVSEEKVMDILAHFESYGVTFIIDNVEDYSQYGLDEPECTLHLTTAENSYDIKMGAFSTMDEQRYIDIGDGNVYLVGEDPMDYVDSSLSTMIQHDDTPGFETVVDITFTGQDSYTVVRTDDSTDTYNSEDIYFTQQDGRTVPLDTASVRQYLNTVTALGLLDYVTYNVTEEELQTYGLDDPELSVTVNYTYTDENEQIQSDTCVLHISQNPEEKAAADEATAAGETAEPVTKYVRIGDSQIVYTLDDADYTTLAAASYDDLRHKEVFWADFETVTQIDVTLEDAQHTITATEDDSSEDAERKWYYGETELDISALQGALEALSADSFTDALPTEVEEISLTLHLNHENIPTVQLQLYRYDGSFCLAVVDGVPVSMVPRSDVMDLVEAVQAIVLN